MKAYAHPRGTQKYVWAHETLKKGLNSDHKVMQVYGFVLACLPHINVEAVPEKYQTGHDMKNYAKEVFALIPSFNMLLWFCNKIKMNFHSDLQPHVGTITSGPVRRCGRSAFLYAAQARPHNPRSVSGSAAGPRRLPSPHRRLPGYLR